MTAPSELVQDMLFSQTLGEASRDMSMFRTFPQTHYTRLELGIIIFISEVKLFQAGCVYHCLCEGPTLRASPWRGLLSVRRGGRQREM